MTLGTLQLRARIRAQIVGRDADILHGVAQMVQVTQESDKELAAATETGPQDGFLTGTPDGKGSKAPPPPPPTTKTYTVNERFAVNVPDVVKVWMV